MAASGIGSGADQGTADAWRSPVLLLISTPPQGCASVDYLAWALAQPDVTRAWVFPLARGAGAATRLCYFARATVRRLCNWPCPDQLAFAFNLSTEGHVLDEK